MTLRDDLTQLIRHTPFIDTHEHLLEESDRLAARTREGVPDFALTGTWPAWPAPDWGWLFSQYAASDLHQAGMPAAEVAMLHSWTLSPQEKFRLLEPWYARARHTGYLQAARAAIQQLFGEDDLRADNADAIAEKFHAAMQPGYYRVVLNDFANIQYAQVNCLQSPVFRETEQPALLAQDISFVGLSTELAVPEISALVGREAGSLADWHAIIEECFAMWGPRAIAVKNQSAYTRALDYARVSKAEAAPLFACHLHDPAALTPGEQKALQDHLFHYCIEVATAHRLPIKLHTGYLADEWRMHLHRVRHNAGDIAELLHAHPSARFVLMHIGWPYDGEMIALAKHFPNAWVDMCWTWIVNPLAGARWLREFLTSVPANKVFCFGGDYLAVESVPGHAALARQGIAQVLEDLVAAHWLREQDVEALVQRLMHGNAQEFYPRTLREAR